MNPESKWLRPTSVEPTRSEPPGNGEKGPLKKTREKEKERNEKGDENEERTT